MFKRCLLLSLLAVMAVPAHANWYLDNDSSRLSFTSLGGEGQAGVHRFLVLKGKVDSKGLAEVDVELESVSTGNAQRDERLREQLFEVKRFPLASINTRLDLAPLKSLASGAQREMSVPVSVELRGKRHVYQADLLVTRLDSRRFQVVTLQPLILQAADFDLLPGFETLRRSGGLSTLSVAVPVGAVLIFAAR